MEILAKNLDKITKYNPTLAKKIENFVFEANIDFQLFQSESGDTNLSYKGINLHSETNPQQEALEIINNLKDVSSNSITLILGLGLGYLFKRAYLSTKSKIIIFEPDLNILKFTLETVDFALELGEENIFIVSNETELLAVLEKAYLYKDVLNICALSSFSQLNPEKAKDLLERLPEMYSHLEANYDCLFENALPWAMEGVKNIPLLRDTYNAGILRDEFKSKPAVIVSPGPSLDKIIESLAQNRDKVLIFATGNSYKALDKHGIKPDFIGFIEVYDNTAQVKDLDISNINIITQPTANNNVFKLDAKRKFVFYGKNDLFALWLSKIADVCIDEEPNKGCVSYISLLTAYIAGCNPIILAGQDLAFSQGKCYSQESAYGAVKLKQDENNGNYFAQIDNISEIEKYIRDENSEQEAAELAKRFEDRINSKIVYVKGQNGEMLPTNPDYAGFIEYFKEFGYIANGINPDLRLYNCSEGGAEIEGFENASFDELMNNLGRLDMDLENAIQKAVEYYSEPVSENYDNIEEMLRDIVEKSEIYIPKAREAFFQAAYLRQEVDRINLDINKIRAYATFLIEMYLDFRDNLFDKHDILRSCVFKELLELCKDMESDNQNAGLESLIQNAELSIAFYGAFINKVSVFKQLILKCSQSSIKAENILQNLQAS